MSIGKVAKLAGVSSSTVSRVINNHPRVAPRTVQSVRAAMKELGYVPSDRRPGPKPMGRINFSVGPGVGAGAAMGTGKAAGAGNIAFLVFGTSPQRTTPAFEELLRGVSFGASRNELNLAFSHVPDAEQMPVRVMDRPIDGFLLHGATPSPELIRQLRKLPTVWLMGNRRRPEWGDQVMPDAYEIGDLAAQYLIERGHRCLAFLNLDASHWPFRLYAQSFSAIASDNGVELHLVQRMPVPSADYWHRFNSESADQVARQLLHMWPIPTGLAIADAMQAAAIQPALQNHGIELGPGKTEIIVCGNEQPHLAGLVPKPASIDLRIESIGQRGVEQLLWRLQHQEVPERIIATIQPFIVIPDQIVVAETASLS
jgi:DNA-binding LacI/PurR family transcriptional regulator